MSELKNSVVRKEVVQMLSKSVSKSLATKIEDSIYNYSVNFCKNNNIDDDGEMCEYTYNEKYEQILNIINANIQVFKKNIKEKKIIPEEIEFLTPQELDPAKWKKLLDKREKARKNLQNANITTEYTCSNCNNKKHTVVSLQTRSADEPMTHFITCTNCQHTFKQ